MILKTLKRIDWLISKLAFIFVVIGGCMTVAMIFTTSFGVAMRYFFRRPEPISYEITTIFMLWGFLFAVAFVEYRQNHIRADIFVGLMPKWLADFLHRVIGPSLALIYCLILTWKGWSVAMYSLKIGERSMSVWGEPLFPIKIMVPVCYALLSLVVLRNLCRGIASYTTWGQLEQIDDAAADQST